MKTPPKFTVNPPPPGLPDARGWQVSPRDEARQPWMKFTAYAYISGERVARLFRAEETARAYAEKYNAQAAADRGAPASAEPLLTSRQMAALLKLSMNQLKELRRRRAIPFIRINRNLHLFRASEVLAALEANREEVKMPDAVFRVESRKHKNYNFRVMGSGQWRGEQKWCVTEAQAVAYARTRNNAVGKKAIGPMPRRVRGMAADDPFYRVVPCHIAARPDLKYEVTCYFEGGKKPKVWRFPTEKEALHCANRGNLETAKRLAQLAPPPAPPPAVATAPRPASAARLLAPLWSEAQMRGIDTPRNHDPMNPPFRTFATQEGKYAFMVRGPRDLRGKYQRKYFRTEREAETYAHMRNTEAQNEGLDSIAFPAWLRVSAQKCHRELQARGHSIEDAARFFLDHLDRTAKSCALSVLIARCLETKAAAGVSKNYVVAMRAEFARFTAFTGAETVVSEILPRRVDEFLMSLTALSPASRNSARQMLCTLFSYGVDAGVCTVNPAEKSAKAKVIPSPVEIFTADELARLLAHAPDEAVPLLAIGAFAGLRVAEIVRLDWAQVDLIDGFIEVTALNAKSARRRLVKILPALDAWIRPRARTAGRVWPHTGFIPYTHLRATMDAAGLAAWPRNGLRHSFASYHIAHFQDAAKLALEMGHTTTNLIFAHYRQVVRRSEGERWWNIRPALAGGEKIINLTQ